MGALLLRGTADFDGLAAYLGFIDEIASRRDAGNRKCETPREIGGGDDRGAFVEPADEMKQELAAGLGEGQIAEFVENDEVQAGQVISEPPLASVAGAEDETPLEQGALLADE